MNEGSEPTKVHGVSAPVTICAGRLTMPVADFGSSVCLSEAKDGEHEDEEHIDEQVLSVQRAIIRITTLTQELDDAHNAQR